MSPAQLRDHATAFWLLLSLVLTVAITATTSFLVINNNREQIAQQVQLQQENILFSHGRAIDTVLKEATLALNKTAAEVAASGSTSAAQGQIASTWRELTINRYRKSLLLTDQDGKTVIYQSTEDAARQPPLRPELAEIEAEPDTTQSYSIIREAETTYLQLQQSIRANSKKLGDLSILLNLSQIIAEHSKPTSYGSQFFALYEQNASTILSAQTARQERTLLDAAASDPVTKKELTSAIARGERLTRTVLISGRKGEQTRGKETLAGEEILLSLTPIHLPNRTWSLAYATPTSHIDRAAPPVFLVIIGFTLILFCAGALFTKACRSRKLAAALKEELSTEKDAQQQQQEELESYRARYHQFVKNSGEALFIVDLEEGSLLEINRQAESLLGYTQGEVEHLTFKVLFSREQQHRFLRLVTDVRKKGYAEAPELKFRRKDGSAFIGEVKATTGWLKQRKVIHGSLRDVTPTINLAIELRRHNRHLSLLNEISQRVAEGHDLQTALEIILDESIKSFGISGGGIFLEGENNEMKLAVHRNIPEEVLEELTRIKPGVGLAGKVMETGRPRLSPDLQKDHRRISTAVSKDGWHAFLAIPIIAEETTLGVLFLFDRSSRVFSREEVRLTQAIGRQVGPLVKNAGLFDELQWQHRLNFASMRELERSEENLRDNLDQLEENHRALQNLNRMKSTFLSLASHELRTPLTSILSGAEFLQEQAGPALDQNCKRALKVITNSGQRLNQIVDDLIEAARLEAKTLYLAQELFNPLLPVKELIMEQAPHASERKLKLSLEEFPDDALIRGDSHHLKRALGRLTENAIKFTPEGGWVRLFGTIRSKAEVMAREEIRHTTAEGFFAGALAEHYIEISVCDNGIGIAEEELTRVFEKFHGIGEISSHSTSRSGFGGKGVGLGLTLAKGVVETHNGLIWAESTGPERGSCFHVLIPTIDPNEEKHVLG